MQNTGIPVAAVICAAGSSARMGGVKKEYLPFPSQTKPFGEKNLSVLGAAVSAFALTCIRNKPPGLDKISPIIITVPPGGEDAAKACLPAGLLAEEGRVLFAAGGATRRASVFNALSLLKSYKPLVVLIHDGARPWIKKKLIERIIEAAILYGAVAPVLPLIETPKELYTRLPENSDLKPAFIKRHPRREVLCTTQTPQGFRFPEILKAHEKAREKEEKEMFEYTDDAGIWGEFIGKVAVIPGDPENRKITFPGDLKESYA